MHSDATISRAKLLNLKELLFNQEIANRCNDWGMRQNLVLHSDPDNIVLSLSVMQIPYFSESITLNKTWQFLKMSHLLHSNLFAHVSNWNQIFSSLPKTYSGHFFKKTSSSISPSILSAQRRDNLQLNYRKPILPVGSEIRQTALTLRFISQLGILPNSFKKITGNRLDNGKRSIECTFITSFHEERNGNKVTET